MTPSINFIGYYREVLGHVFCETTVRAYMGSEKLEATCPMWCSTRAKDSRLNYSTATATASGHAVALTDSFWFIVPQGLRVLQSNSPPEH